jgi:hypothetical protein
MVYNNLIDSSDILGLAYANGGSREACCGGKKYNTREKSCCNDSQLYKNDKECCASSGVKPKKRRHENQGQSLQECINSYMENPDGSPSATQAAATTGGSIIGGFLGAAIGSYGGPHGTRAGATAGAGAGAYQGNQSSRSAASGHCKELVCP